MLKTIIGKEVQMMEPYKSLTVLEQEEAELRRDLLFQKYVNGVLEMTIELLIKQCAAKHTEE